LCYIDVPQVEWRYGLAVCLTTRKRGAAAGGDRELRRGWREKRVGKVVHEEECKERGEVRRY